MALLPNDGAALGGERPIGFSPDNCANSGPLELSAWCDAAHGFWDEASAISSALRSAIHTSLMMETTHILGISAGVFFSEICRNSTTALAWCCFSRRVMCCSIPVFPCCYWCRLSWDLARCAPMGTTVLRYSYEWFSGRILSGQASSQSVPTPCFA